MSRCEIRPQFSRFGSAVSFTQRGARRFGNRATPVPWRGVIRCALCVGIWASAPLFAAPAPAPSSPPQPAIKLQPAVVAFARAHQILIDEIEPASSSEDARIGDAFTAVVM